MDLAFKYIRVMRISFLIFGIFIYSVADASEPTIEDLKKIYQTITFTGKGLEIEFEKDRNPYDGITYSKGSDKGQPVSNRNSILLLFGDTLFLEGIHSTRIFSGAKNKENSFTITDRSLNTRLYPVHEEAESFDIIKNDADAPWNFVISNYVPRHTVRILKPD